MADYFDQVGTKVVSPTKLAHVVLRTSKFEEMTNFYKVFLGGTVMYENSYLSFITYDDEHHRIAIGAVPGTAPKEPTTSGLEHIAFTFDSLNELALSYRQRKEKSILPFWCINHGPTTSIYYKDPDGNQLETQVDNFTTAEEASEFMHSKYFDENPIGTDFDPEELIRRLRSGEDHESIKKRIENGPRGLGSALEAISA